MRLGSGFFFFDAQIEHFSIPSSMELIAVDDTPLTKQDPGCSIVVPETERTRRSYFGKPRTGVRESLSAAHPARSATARLYPGWRPIGEEVEVTFLGDPKGTESRRKISFPKEPKRKTILCGSRMRRHQSVAVAVSFVNLNELTGKGNLTTRPTGAKFGVGAPVRHWRDRKTRASTILHVHGQERSRSLTFVVPLANSDHRSMPVVWITEKDGTYITGSDDSEAAPISYFSIHGRRKMSNISLAIRDHLFRGGATFGVSNRSDQHEPRLELSLARVM